MFKLLSSALTIRIAHSEKAGALVTFEGLVRNNNEGKKVVALAYEAAEALCKAWQLPDTITRVLAHQNDPHYRDVHWQGSELLRLSKAMIKQLGEATPDSLAPLANDNLGISFSDLRAEYRRLEKLHPRINELAHTLFLA